MAKPDYCIAVLIAGTVHRTWNPRKNDAVSFARRLANMAMTTPPVEGIAAVAVIGGESCAVHFEWPKGSAEGML